MNNPKEKLRQFYITNGIVETSKVTGLSYQRIVDELNLPYKNLKTYNLLPIL